MEMQQPPQKELTTISAYVNSNEIKITKKTLPTTKEYQQHVQKKEQEQLQIKVNVECLQEDSTKLQKRLNALITEFDEQTAVFNQKFEELEDKIEIAPFINHSKSNNSVKKPQTSPSINLQDSLKCLSSDNFGTDDEISEKSASEEQLTLDEKFEQLEEKVESFLHFFKESLKSEDLAKNLQSVTVVGIQEAVAELTDDIDALKKQIKSNNPIMEKHTEDVTIIQKSILKLIDELNLIKDQTKNDLTKIKSQQESQELLISMGAETTLNIQERLKKLEENDRLVDKDITTLYDSALEYEEIFSTNPKTNTSVLDLQQQLTKFEKDEELIKELIKTVVKLENETIKQQNQSISSLWRWVKVLGAFSGGSAIALAVWLWHYTHK